MNIDQFIEDAGNKLHSDYPKFTGSIMRRVSRLIRENVEFSTGVPKISDDVLLRIRESLIVANNVRSQQTILLWDCYNQLNLLLSTSCQFTSGYIKTPRQTQRLLLVHSDKIIMSHIEYIDKLTYDLLSFSPPSSKDPHAREIHYACTYVSAAAIYGKILFPSFYKFLLSLRIGQIYYDPDYIIKTVEDSNAITRYFLPYPVNLLLNRLILFCRDQRSTKHKSPETYLEMPAFHFSAFTIETFPSVYRAWLTERLQIDPSKAMSISDFRRAVIASSILGKHDHHSGTGPYPPFIITAMSETIPSYSFGNNSLSYLIPGYEPERVDYGTKPVKRSFVEFQSISLYHAIKELTSRRESLEKDDNWKKQRPAVESKYLSILSEYKTHLGSFDFINLELYAKWILSMMHGRNKISSTNTDASLLSSFLSELSNMGKIVYELVDDDYPPILTRMAKRYATTKIIQVMIAFLEFVSIERDNQFTFSDLYKLVRTLKLNLKNRPTLKQFISFDELYCSLHELMFHNHGFSDKDQPLLSSYNNQHLPFTRRHVAQLVYHSGLRIDEVCNLQLTDVFEDDGITLFVRDSKTNNGRRNLPLSLLAPDSYLSEFHEYIVYRKSLPTSNTYLFVNSFYNRFENNSLTEPICACLENQGITDPNFHLLRHAFGNTFLLLWIAAFYGDILPPDTPFLEWDAFSHDNIEKFKKIFLGMGPSINGQESSTFVLQVLARLLGHGGPIISLQDYIHIIDWIFYLISNHYELKEVSLTLQQAADLLQISIPTLRKELVKIGSNDLSPKTISLLQIKKILLH